MVISSSSLLAYGVNGTIGEVELPNISGLHSLQPFLDQERIIVLQVIIHLPMMKPLWMISQF